MDNVIDEVFSDAIRNQCTLSTPDSESKRYEELADRLLLERDINSPQVTAFSRTTGHPESHHPNLKDQPIGRLWVSLTWITTSFKSLEINVYFL